MGTEACACALVHRCRTYVYCIFFVVCYLFWWNEDFHYCLISISYWFTVATLLVLLLVGVTSSKNSKALLFQVGSGWNLAGLFFK